MATGNIKAQTTETKTRAQEFMDNVMQDLLEDKYIHVILDSYCTHKKNDDWLKKYDGRVQFHFDLMEWALTSLYGIRVPK